MTYGRLQARQQSTRIPHGVLRQGPNSASDNHCRLGKHVTSSPCGEQALHLRRTVEAQKSCTMLPAERVCSTCARLVSAHGACTCSTTADAATAADCCVTASTREVLRLRGSDGPCKPTAYPLLACNSGGCRKWKSLHYITGDLAEHRQIPAIAALGNCSTGYQREENAHLQRRPRARRRPKPRRWLRAWSERRASTAPRLSPRARDLPRPAREPSAS